ncbi:MAG: hypothetical protein Kow00128_19160 [Deltaproteobacteria bacterium]
MKTPKDACPKCGGPKTPSADACQRCTRERIKSELHGWFKSKGSKKPNREEDDG